MTEDQRDPVTEGDQTEAEISEAAANLHEIARQLRELADVIVDLTSRPIEQKPPSFH